MKEPCSRVMVRLSGRWIDGLGPRCNNEGIAMVSCGKGEEPKDKALD